MSNRTWACVPCGKTFRRVQSISELTCPDCGLPCEYLPWKMRVPPASHRTQWLDFWKKYRVEKQSIAAHLRGEHIAEGKLELLNMTLAQSSEQDAEQRSARKWKQQKRRADAAKDRQRE